MNSFKGTSAFWKKFKSEVLALVKQYVVPTLFITLSCADFRQDELIEIIQKLNKADKADVDMSDLSYHERRAILNNNSVMAARHFKYRVEGIFQNLFLLMGLLANQNIMPSE